MAASHLGKATLAASQFVLPRLVSPPPLPPPLEASPMLGYPAITLPFRNAIVANITFIEVTTTNNILRKYNLVPLPKLKMKSDR